MRAKNPRSLARCHRIKIGGTEFVPVGAPNSPGGLWHPGRFLGLEISGRRDEDAHPVQYLNAHRHGDVRGTADRSHGATDNSSVRADSSVSN